MQEQEIKSRDEQVKVRYIPKKNIFEFSTDGQILGISTEALEAIIKGEVKMGTPFTININIDTQKKPYETIYTFQEYIPPQNEEHNVA